jgi:hypothetical protein
LTASAVAPQTQDCQTGGGDETKAVNDLPLNRRDFGVSVSINEVHR